MQSNISKNYAANHIDDDDIENVGNVIQDASNFIDGEQAYEGDKGEIYAFFSEFVRLIAEIIRVCYILLDFYIRQNYMLTMSLFQNIHYLYYQL